MRKNIRRSRYARNEGAAGAPRKRTAQSGCHGAPEGLAPHGEASLESRPYHEGRGLSRTGGAERPLGRKTSEKGKAVLGTGAPDGLRQLVGKGGAV